ncbi:unnamed protein product [Ambrosiozyma monospora]|uniref:Unnamed protein product n=1 Tax=Ambrosiozyma monospora TaxID=43982 RepID=A0A9W6YU74_AMBMO|nr:unnamed protein product [Ambrosiozyma monospora]
MPNTSKQDNETIDSTTSLTTTSSTEAVINYGSTLNSSRQPYDIESQDQQRPDHEPSITQTDVSPLTVKIVFFCSVANTFLSSLDSTLVSTLLTKIASDLNQLSNIQWVATSYLLSCAAFQPLFGKLSNVFGRKPIILSCTVMFSLGCLICGLSTNLWTLVIGRFITGIGGGGFNTMSSISMSDVVSVRQRGLYQGYINIFFQLGAASGGVFAGFFAADSKGTGFSLGGWRNAFLVQVPICLLTGGLVWSWFELPEGSPGNGDKNVSHWSKVKSLDFTGSGLLVSSLFCLMYAISMDGSVIVNLNTEFVSWFLIGLVLLVVFYHYDLNVADQPIIPVELLHNRTILFASLALWFVSMNMFASLYYVPFYWQSVKNLSPMDAGLRLIPSIIFASMSSIFAGYMMRLTATYKKLLIWSGIAVLLGSTFVYSSSRVDSAWWDSIICIPSRIGMAGIITAALIAMIANVTLEEQALVTSISYAFRSTGSTLGVSLASAVLQFTLARKINSSFDKLSDKIPDELVGKIDEIRAKALEDPTFAFNGCPGFFKESIVQSYDFAGHAVFMFLIITGVATLVCLWPVHDRDLNKKQSDE